MWTNGYKYSKNVFFILHVYNIELEDVPQVVGVHLPDWL